MRILVSGFTSNYGGVESFVMNYYREMKHFDQNVIIDLLSYTAQPAYREELEKMGGHVYMAPSPLKPDHKTRIHRFFQEHSGFYDVFWCNKCDLHDIDFLQAAVGCVPKRILHAHSSKLNYDGVRNWAFGALHRINKRRAANLATDYWACSDWAAQWIFPEQVIERSAVQFIPNAIRLNAFAFDGETHKKYREDLNLQGTVYGCVGRLNHIKNISFALQTFYSIWKRQANSCLLVVGTGELEDPLRQEAQALPCRDHIFFLGMRRDVPQLLQAMDCYLMPSLFEGFPVASIEAQAAGLPVFAASDGITPQAQLTDLFHFLPLSIGPEGWAEQILQADLSRRDRQDVLREKGFDITLAASHLLHRLTG